MLQQDFVRHYPENSLMEVIQGGNESIGSELGDSIENKISSLTENASSIRRKLEREGEVDPQSIELYEQERGSVRVHDQAAQRSSRRKRYFRKNH